jgi:transcriptional regulator with XRE-family HTH domain
VSIGETLAEARRQAGLTVTQVSERTRIRESIIRAIENDDFSTCGGDFYARGHIRSIASVVGTDPVPLIREYDAEHGPPGAISAADVFEPARPVRIREPRTFGFGKVMIVVLLAVIGAAAYLLVSHVGKHNSSAPPPRRATRATVTPAAHPSATAVATTPPPEKDVIKLTANADCWVLLTRPDGAQIYMGVISAGSSMKWTEKHTVELRLGNPPGVVLTVNGKVESTSSTNPVTLSITPGHTVEVTAH